MSQAIFDFYASNEHIEYPFLVRQDDGYHNLFVDAFVSHNSPNQGLVRLASFDPAGTLELRFDDGSLLASLTIVDNFITSVFGAYTLYEWKRLSTITKGFTGLVLAVRLIVVSRRLATFAYPRSSSTAYLNPARVNPRLRGVDSYAVAVPGEECCQGTPGRESLILQAGFNTALEVVAPEAGEELVEASTPVRNPTRIAIHLNAGEGLGLFPVCEDPKANIKTIKSVGPDDVGDFKLEGKDCTWVESRLAGPVLSPVHPNTDYLSQITGALNAAFVQLHQGCRACCDCQDYARAYQLLTETWDRAYAVVVRLQNAASLYNTVRSKWESEKASREIGRSLNIRTMARPDFYVDLAFTVSNNKSGELLNPTKLTVSFNPASNPTPVYVEGTGYLEASTLHNERVDPYNQGGGVFTVSIPSIKPGNYAVYRMSVRYAEGTRAARAVVVTATAADLEGGGGSRWLQAQTILLKPLDKS